MHRGKRKQMQAHTHTCLTCGRAASEGGGGCDGRGDGGREVAAGVARGRGRAVPGHAPSGDGQGQLGSGLLLQGLLLPPRCVRHEPADRRTDGRTARRTGVTTGIHHKIVGSKDEVPAWTR